MRPSKSVILLAGAASLLALGACNSAKDATQAAKGPAAATVNGTAIGQRTVDAIARQGAAAGRPDTPETRKAIIDQLVMQMVVAEEALKKGLDKAPEVAEQIDAVKQSVLANAYVRDFIKSNPVSDEVVKAEYERIKATVSGSQYKARHILVEKESEARRSSRDSGRTRGPLRNWRWKNRRIPAPSPRAAISDGSIRAGWCPNSAPP